jgi:hypothetical protein
MAEGYFPKPVASRAMDAPKMNPVILFDESRCTVTEMSVIAPEMEPPPTMIRREVRVTSTAAGHAYAPAGTGDFTGADHPPVIGSELA